MSGQRGFDGDLRGFHVARFTDENDVGILPQKCAKDAREIQPDILVRLDLAQAGKIVFNRIFGGGNVDFRRIDFVQRAVQRGRLTRSRRSGDIDDAVGLIDHPSQLLDRRRMDNDLIERQ